MNEDQDLLQLIRQAMKSPNKAKTTTKNKAVTSKQTKEGEHGKLGDFSRSNSNPISRAVRDSATVGFEEVPSTRLHRKHSDNQNVVINAETEMVRRAIRIAINSTGGAPSKRAAKRAASPKMTRSDRVFKTTGPGSSRSVTLDAIKAINSKETGCIVRDPKKVISIEESQRNSNTTQGNYNPMIIEK